MVVSGQSLSGEGNHQSRPEPEYLLSWLPSAFGSSKLTFVNTRVGSAARRAEQLVLLRGQRDAITVQPTTSRAAEIDPQRTDPDQLRCAGRVSRAAEQRADRGAELWVGVGLGEHVVDAALEAAARGASSLERGR